MSIDTSAKYTFNPNIILDGTLKGNKTTISWYEYSQIKVISQSSYTASVQKEVLAAAGISAGKKIVVEGLDFIVDEVSGEITDKATEHIYAKSKNGILKKIPIAKVLTEKVATKITNTSAYTALMNMNRLKPKLNIPLATALEFALSPSQAACATTDTMYIKNICEPSKPLELLERFSNGTLKEKKEILKSGCYEIQDFLNLKRDLISKVLAQKYKEVNAMNVYDFKCNIADNSLEDGSFISDMNYMPDAITNGNSYNNVFKYTYLIDPICRDYSDLSKYNCKIKFKIEQLSSDKKTVESWIEYNIEGNSGGIVKSNVKSSVNQTLMPEHFLGDPYDFIYGNSYIYDNARLTDKEKIFVEKVNEVPITLISQRINDTCYEALKKSQSPSGTQTEAVY
jgi:hypothetical protein